MNPQNPHQLDQMDEYRIYLQNTSKRIKDQLLGYKNQSNFPTSQNLVDLSQQQRNPVKTPNKFSPRPILLKYVNQIQRLYLDQKSPHQIQEILKVPYIKEIQYILKQKIHTFLNIIFESSHRYTQEEVQKIKPEVDQKIERISIELVEPLSRGFLDEIKFKNFLKLMKYHKEGRRSEKINKKCYTFFRLFFITMKFDGINHAEGNLVQLSDDNQYRKHFLREKNYNQDEEDFDLQVINSSKNQTNSNKKGSIYNKKYKYPKQHKVNQKVMDEATENLIREIRNKINTNKEQILNNSINYQPEKNKNLITKSQITCPQTQSNSFEYNVKNFKLRPIEWTFDKQNTLLYLLFQSIFLKLKLSKSIKLIESTLSSKYLYVYDQNINFEIILAKIQSMYSISCQKLLRRLKYLTIKQSLQINKNPQKQDYPENKGKTLQSQHKKRIYSIIDIQKSIEEENEKYKLQKQDEFYFSKLKQKLKSFDVKQVYFSSHQKAACAQEWKFMLDLIRDCYFTSLEDLNFEFLLKVAKRTFLVNRQNKNLTEVIIPIDEEESVDQKEQIVKIKQKSESQIDGKIDLIQKLPKSSLSLTLSRITRSKFFKQKKIYDIEQNQQWNQQRDEQGQRQLKFTQISETIQKSLQNNRYFIKNKSFSSTSQITPNYNQSPQTNQKKYAKLQNQQPFFKVKQPNQLQKKSNQLQLQAFNQNEYLKNKTKNNLNQNEQLKNNTKNNPNQNEYLKNKTKNNPEIVEVKVTQIEKMLGQPNKKIKTQDQFEDQINIQDSEILDEAQEYTSEQYEEVIELSQPIYAEIMKKNTNQKFISDQDQNNRFQGKQIQKNLALGQKNKDWQRQIEDRNSEDQAQQKSEQGELKQQKIEYILYKIEEEMQTYKPNPAKGRFLKNQEKQHKRACSKDFFQKQKQTQKNKIELEDQYSFSEIDFPIQSQVIQNTTKNTKTYKKEFSENKKDFDSKDLQNSKSTNRRTNSISSMSDIDIIKKQLQKIKFIQQKNQSKSSMHGTTIHLDSENQ